MKIYVVTKGTYSDYHIIMATLDKNIAEKMSKIHSDRFDKAIVEEYDDGIENNFPTFEVVSNKGKNEIRMVLFYDAELEELGKIVDCYNDYYYAYVKAENEQRAEKIFYDLLTEYKARKEGIC